MSEILEIRSRNQYVISTGTSYHGRRQHFSFGGARQQEFENWGLHRKQD